MKTKSITSLKELNTELQNSKKVYLLLYKKGSEQSDCALQNLEATTSEEEDFTVLTADVTIVRDIHPVFGVKTAPALLEFESGEFKNIIKGCHQPAVLKALFDEAVYMARMEKEGKEVKRVTVYSTPTCTW